MLFWHKFVSLRLDMKNVVLKYVSALLALWYCLSIIGFDVHSCNTTGSIFVSSVLAGTTCDDIHPEHDCCSHGACCRADKTCKSSCCEHHPAEESVICSDDDCCTNEIEVLDSAVIILADEDDHIQLSETYACLFVENNFDSILFAECFDLLYETDSGFLRTPDSQALLNIWRI